MRRLLAAAVAAMTIVVSVRADDIVLSRFADYLESLRAQAGIPGLAAAIVGSSDVIWDRPFGQQDVEKLSATSSITPFYLDGLTQTVAAALVLRCVDRGNLSLDDPIGKFSPGSADAGATVREILSHTSRAADGTLTFSYRPQRLSSLGAVVNACAGESFRAYVVNEVLERFQLIDSVPGGDAMAADQITAAQKARYAGVLARLAAPYSVDGRGRATRSQYSATALTPAAGLVSTVRDFARFDAALRNGAIVRSAMLGLAWSPPAGRDGRALPHGLGWFVQSYNGERIVWQFGQADNASSSLVLTVPSRSLTLVLLANSDGLSKSFSLADGDVTSSPFARAFLGLFIR